MSVFVLGVVLGAMFGFVGGNEALRNKVWAWVSTAATAILIFVLDAISLYVWGM